MSEAFANCCTLCSLRCGDGATYQSSGYDKIYSAIEDYSIPTLFTEYGCNLIRPRLFPEVDSIYGTMSDVLSGAIVYKYFEDDENFGMQRVLGLNLCSTPLTISRARGRVRNICLDSR